MAPNRKPHLTLVSLTVRDGNSTLVETIKTFHAIALGDSHKTECAPCQDFAATFEDPEKGIFIGAISDGHGGNDYFRSDRGSRLIVNIAIESIREFVKSCETSIFYKDFRQRKTHIHEINEGVDHKDSLEDIALQRLFSCIITRWNDAIKEDWFKETPTEEDFGKFDISPEALQSYLHAKDIEIAYGCTLIAFARTTDYWFAFHLGDGKCIAFSTDLDPWEPIPWDEQCKGNITTSISEMNAIENFRYS